MRTVAIGESGEYGERLVRFLEKHLSSDIHIVRYTEEKKFMEQVPSDACCIIADDFTEVCNNSYQRLIMLGDYEAPDTFCRYHSPMELVDMIEQNWKKKQEEKALEEHTVLRAIYTPIYMENMHQVAMQYMKEGELCIGMENMGEQGEDEHGNMSDLCYYIRLRKEDILDYVEQIAYKKKERYFIDSPDLYFDLADLSMEDLQWFLEQLKNSTRFHKVYILMGSSAVQKAEILKFFQQVILVTQKGNLKLKCFFERLREILLTRQIQQEHNLSLVYREDFM